MKTILKYLLIIIILNSCISIRNRKDLMSIKKIGLNKQELKLNGYYYQLKEYETYPYYRNNHGGYQQQDTTTKYNQIRIIPLTLYSNGSINSLYSFSGFQDNSAFNRFSGLIPRRSASK